jgi:hypothetical protein
MKKLLAVLGVVSVLTMGVLVWFIERPVPLLDADRSLLAQTYNEGYCSGTVFVKSNGRGDEYEAEECRNNFKDEETNNEIDHSKVPNGFCQGILNAGLPVPVDECVVILRTNTLWPTLDGRLSNSWNRAYPYPGMAVNLQDDTGGRTGEVGDRTGDRETFIR